MNPIPDTKAVPFIILITLTVLASCRGGFVDPAYQEIMDGQSYSQPEVMISQLVSAIKNQNDYEKVKSIHNWVADKLDYDYDTYYSGSISDQSYSAVLRSGLAVCEGYANVFNDLCRRAEIRCEKIIGYARGVGTSPFLPEGNYYSNHAWNMVYVNGKWNLIDVTWDDNDNGTIGYDYFFIAPERMIYDHYPGDSARQLLERPLSYSEFTNLPYVDPGYFDVVTDMRPAPRKAYKTSLKEFSLDFKTKDGWNMIWDAVTENGTLINQSYTRLIRLEDGWYRAAVTFPGAGRFYLFIYANQDIYGSYHQIAKFGIEVE